MQIAKKTLLARYQQRLTDTLPSVANGLALPSASDWRDTAYALEKKVQVKGLFEDYYRQLAFNIPNPSAVVGDMLRYDVLRHGADLAGDAAGLMGKDAWADSIDDWLPKDGALPAAGKARVGYLKKEAAKAMQVDLLESATKQAKQQVDALTNTAKQAQRQLSDTLNTLERRLKRSKTALGSLF